MASAIFPFKRPFTMTRGNDANFLDRIKKTEIGKLICTKDWRRSSLGEIEQWPVSIRTALTLCVTTPLPVAIWWGKELIVFYNDAFRDVMGINDRESFGENGHNLAAKIDQDLKELLLNILDEGKVSQCDKTLTLNRERDRFEHHITIHNSPIYGESENVEGIYMTATGSNQPLLSWDARTQIEENEARLRIAVESTNLGMWDYKPLTGEMTWSDKCREIYAIPPNEPVTFESFADHIHPEDKAYVESAIAKAMDPGHGGDYSITYRILRFSDGAPRWIRAHGKVYFNAKRETERFIGTVVDVTDEKEYEIKLRESEQRMRLALRASEMGTFDWNISDSDFQYSDRLAEIFGYSNLKNLTHQDFIGRIHPDDGHIRVKAHEEAFKTGMLFYEARIIWPDGSIHWIRLTGYTLFDSNRKPKRMYGTTLDITESKFQAEALEEKVMQRTRELEQINEELKKSEERYVNMTEEVQDYAIILLDKQGTILNWNKGAEKIKGYSEEEIVGKNFSIFYLDADRERKLPQSLIRKAEDEGRAMHEGWRRRKDGSEFWGSIVITALHNTQNDIVGFTKVTRDLTERKLAEDLMKQHASELEIKNKQLEQFAYVASHDLQEPLRKIQTFVQVLDKKIDNREIRQRYIEKIKSSAKRMTELIQAVLNYSRLSQTDQLWVLTDLNAVLESVKTDYELLIVEKKAVIYSDSLPSIKGMPHQLSQLFANLIGNSLKFAKETPVIKITASVKEPRELQGVHATVDPSKRYLELKFSDNGIGFDQHYAEKIFTIFQRLNSREEYEGTGIGLALCKRIVENHQGYISATGQLGIGATFQIYLPIE